MPLPQPVAGEDRDDFIARFTREADISDTDQRLAAAFATWGRQYVSKARGGGEVVMKGETLVRASPGRLEGYASIYDQPDLDGEVVAKGAFAKTLTERVAAGRVPLLIGHNDDALATVGYMSPESREDEIGLYGVFDLLDTPRAKEVHSVAKAAAEAGTPMGLSVGMDVLQREGSTFKEVRLIHVALTPQPACEGAAVTIVKSADLDSVRRRGAVLNAMIQGMSL